MAWPAPQSRGARGSAVTAGRRAAAARGDPPADEAAPRVGRDGHAADPDVGTRSIRSRGQRQLGPGQLPQGGAADGADRQPGRDLRPDEERRRADRSGPGAWPRGEFSLHAHREPSDGIVDARVRHRPGAARRSRAERVHLCRARGRRHLDRSLLGHCRGDRHVERAASRRGQRGCHAAADRDRSGGDPRARSTKRSAASSRAK